MVALMSTAPKVAAFAVLLRVTYSAYPALQAHWLLLIWIMAALSMTVGNLGALRQHNVKRMMAYSSIAHAGYTLVAFTAFSSDGIAAAMFYVAAYSAMNVGAFAVISHAGGYDERLVSIADYRGLAYRFPLLGGALAFFLLSLIGIPFTGGFFGKFYAFSCGAALRRGVARDHRPIEQRRGRLLLSAPAHLRIRQARGRCAGALSPEAESLLNPRLAAHSFRHINPGHFSRHDSLDGPRRSSDPRRAKRHRNRYRSHGSKHPLTPAPAPRGVETLFPWILVPSLDTRTAKEMNCHPDRAADLPVPS